MGGTKSLIDHEALVKKAFTPEDDLIPTAEEVLKNHKGASIVFVASRMNIGQMRAEFLINFIKGK